MTALGILWYFLIFLLIAGYFVLDGFDLGAGVLYPFLAKTDEEKELMLDYFGDVIPFIPTNQYYLVDFILFIQYCIDSRQCGMSISKVFLIFVLSRTEYDGRVTGEGNSLL